MVPPPLLAAEWFLPLHWIHHSLIPRLFFLFFFFFRTEREEKWRKWEPFTFTPFANVHPLFCWILSLLLLSGRTFWVKFVDSGGRGVFWGGSSCRFWSKASYKSGRPIIFGPLNYWRMFLFWLWTSLSLPLALQGKIGVRSPLNRRMIAVRSP